MGDEPMIELSHVLCIGRAVEWIRKHVPVGTVKCVGGIKEKVRDGVGYSCRILSGTADTEYMSFS